LCLILINLWSWGSASPPWLEPASPSSSYVIMLLVLPWKFGCCYTFWMIWWSRIVTCSCVLEVLVVLGWWLWLLVQLNITGMLLYCLWLGLWSTTHAFAWLCELPLSLVSCFDPKLLWIGSSQWWLSLLEV
jgi:hypothetical protein